MEWNTLDFVVFTCFCLRWIWQGCLAHVDAYSHSKLQRLVGTETWLVQWPWYNWSSIKTSCIISMSRMCDGIACHTLTQLMKFYCDVSLVGKGNHRPTWCWVRPVLNLPYINPGFISMSQTFLSKSPEAKTKQMTQSSVFHNTNDFLSSCFPIFPSLPWIYFEVVMAIKLNDIDFTN